MLSEVEAPPLYVTGRRDPSTALRMTDTTDVKKNFMIEDFPNIDVLKGANLLSEDEDTEKALHAIAADDHDNIFVGTVDYGDMLFRPKEEEGEPANRIPVTTAEKMIADYPECVYAKIMKYCLDNNLQPSEVSVYLAPFMSIAGDHAHNDLWGLEALAEHDNDNYYQQTVELNTNEYSWRERLTKIGFNVNKDFESHPVGQADADHGIKDGCGMKALGSYPEIRQIWINHLYENWNDADAWENGEGYQPES